MSLSTTISQYAASNPSVAAAVADQGSKSALLYSMQTGDADGNVLSALYSQESMTSQLLGSAAEPFLGNNLDIKA